MTLVELLKFKHRFDRKISKAKSLATKSQAHTNLKCFIAVTGLSTMASVSQRDLAILAVLVAVTIQSKLRPVPAI